MKISVLTPDLSSNCLGRAWLLAKILQRNYEVEVIGPMFGASIWEPVKLEFPYVSVKGSFFPRFIPEMCKMVRKINGDVIYASKPVFTSFTTGLIKKYIAARPLVLDIDDWEVGILLNYIGLLGKRDIMYPNSYWSTRFNERLTSWADAVTVSNRFLQQRFGGTLVCHARDTEHLDPYHYDGKRIKLEYGLADKKVVTFLGSPRPHKGIEDLISAVAILQEKKVVLMIVGLDDSEYSKDLRKMIRESLSEEQVLDLGIQPINDVPKLLSLTDLVVIPQRKSVATVGQVPARVFDAMAMAKPIIATAVSDLPEILDDTGWILEPENPKELSERIAYVLHNPTKAEEMGCKARQRCIERYSYDVAEGILTEIFNGL